MGSKQPSVPTNTTTTQTVNSNTIPDFMRPYFDTMMGTASNQVYQHDAQGNVTGMTPWQPYSTNGADYVAGLSPTQQQAITSASNMKMPGQFQQGSQMTAQAGAASMAAGKQAAGAGANYQKMATDPNAINSYMSPYMKNVVDYQTQQANRQYDITGQQEQAAATNSGAFGGSREAIMAAENERNRNQAITGIQATGAQNAFENAQQAQQFGANLGLQGTQIGMQGYGQGIAAGQGLGQLGSQQLAGQQGIINTQAQQGAIQQGQQQQAINAAVNNQQMAQMYPMEQMNFMSGLLRGIPTQGNQSVTQYQAQPSMASQLFGGIGALGNMYQAYKHKEGGLVNYSVGGEVESDLYKMSPEALQEVIQNSTSDIEKSIAKKVLAEKSMAGGGIVAFSEGGASGSWEPVNNHMSEEEAKQALLGAPKHKTIRGLVNHYANKHGVDPDLMMRSLKAESNFNPNARSPAGAQGIAQFMPETAKRFGVKDTGNVGQSIEGMAKYHKFLSDRYDGDPKKIAAAYNAGEGRVDKYVNKGVPLPKETQNYVASVTGGGLQDIPVGSPQEEQPTTIPQVQDSAATREGMDMIDQQVQADAAEANKSFASRMQEVNAQRQEGGLGDNEATQQRRSDIMAERANSKDEANRQFHMRMADFFAHWGSTPGPVISAGLKALTETMPGMLEDKKDQEKLQRELDDAQYQVAQADRLEQEGKYKEAAGLKNTASENLRNSAGVKQAALIAHGKHIESLQNQQNVASTYAGARVDAANAKGPGGVSGDINPWRRAQLVSKTLASVKNNLAKQLNYSIAKPEVQKQMEWDAVYADLSAILGEEEAAKQMQQMVAKDSEQTDPNAQQPTQATVPVPPIAPLQQPAATGGWKVIR